MLTITHQDGAAIVNVVERMEAIATVHGKSKSVTAVVAEIIGFVSRSETNRDVPAMEFVDQRIQ